MKFLTQTLGQLLMQGVSSQGRRRVVPISSQGRRSKAGVSTPFYNRAEIEKNIRTIISVMMSWTGFWLEGSHWIWIGQEID